jgi:putative endonuclease
MDKREVGKKGEELASEYLIKNGYDILGANYRKRQGEIDIIAMDKKMGEIVFVEVKSRKSISCGYPEEAVDDIKMEKIINTANLWLEEKEMIDKPWRIDIIAIETAYHPPKITHINNVTQDL